MTKVKLKINFVKLNFYKCAHFLLLWFLSTLCVYPFHCFSMSFLLLYLSFHLDSLHHHPDSLHLLYSTQIPDSDFKKIVTLVKKQTHIFVTSAYIIHTIGNHCLHHLRHQWYHQKLFVLKCLKPIICVWSMSKWLWVNEVLPKINVKREAQLAQNYQFYFL